MNAFIFWSVQRFFAVRLRTAWPALLACPEALVATLKLQAQIVCSCFQAGSPGWVQGPSGPWRRARGLGAPGKTACGRLSAESGLDSPGSKRALWRGFGRAERPTFPLPISVFLFSHTKSPASLFEGRRGSFFESDYRFRMVSSVSLSKKCRRVVSKATLMPLSPARVAVRGSTRAMMFSSLPLVDMYR